MSCLTDGPVARDETVGGAAGGASGQLVVTAICRGTIGQATHGDNLLQPVRFCKSALIPRP